jgi:hypothetical protein
MDLQPGTQQSNGAVKAISQIERFGVMDGQVKCLQLLEGLVGGFASQSRAASNMLTEQFSRMQQGSKGEEVCSKFTAEVIGYHPRELSQPEQFANIKTIVHLVSPRSVLKKTEKVIATL